MKEEVMEVVVYEFGKSTKMMFYVLLFPKTKVLSGRSIKTHSGLCNFFSKGPGKFHPCH